MGCFHGGGGGVHGTERLSVTFYHPRLQMMRFVVNIFRDEDIFRFEKGFNGGLHNCCDAG